MVCGVLWISSFQSTLPVWGATLLPLNLLNLLRFQSTLPVWGATRSKRWADRMLLISIHAPRVGSDKKAWEEWHNYHHFNPRSPCGERLTNLWAVPGSNSISIHAPRVGSDNSFQCCQQSRFDFNPRSPWGERLRMLNRLPVHARFQSTLPVGGATGVRLNHVIKKLFQSTLPVGGATGC